MRKFLIVLMVVAMASFLFVGCIPIIPDDDEDEPDEPVVICPVVEVTSQVAVEGKNYIKGGKQTITVIFAVPTEPVSVYVGYALKNGGVPGIEVVMYPNAEKTEYTGATKFGEDEDYECGEAYIYVETCETCDYCKYPYTVDTEKPYVKLEVEVSGDLEDCPCGGCAMIISSVAVEDECDPDVVCCGDDCSGLASWSFRIFSEYPWSECCDTGCEEPTFEDSGVGCPIEVTTDCLDEGVYYFVAVFSDEVGNEVNVADTFEIVVDEGVCYLLPYADPILPDACDYDDLCWALVGDTMMIIIDPSGTMPVDCEETCLESPTEPQ